MSSDVQSLTERQRQKLLAQPATIGDCNDIAFEHARRIALNISVQIPELVHQICHVMIAEALASFTKSLNEVYVLTPRASGPDLSIGRGLPGNADDAGSNPAQVPTHG